MIDTERSIEDLARLQKSIQKSQAILVKSEEALARMRTQVASLKASLDRGRPATAPVALTHPVPVARPVQARPVQARAATVVSARTSRWRTAAPYAAILACAAFLELSGARRPSPQAAVPENISRPAPTVLSDDDRSQEALLLVHEWKLPGDDSSLSERLGGALDLPGARPAWSVERTGARGYRVTYQENAVSLPYAFDADLEGRAVWPTAETQELLAPRLVSLRDAVR